MGMSTSRDGRPAAFSQLIFIVHRQGFVLQGRNDGFSAIALQMRCRKPFSGSFVHLPREPGFVGFQII
jgi:hypothetical protein